VIATVTATVTRNNPEILRVCKTFRVLQYKEKK
jgi:hypothetical protein